MSFGPFADTAHIAVTGIPHNIQNMGMTAEAVRVAARRGQAGHRTPEGVFDQFLGVAQLILERRPVVAQCNQVRVGEAMALDIE